ncbi:ecdysone-inducible gene L2 [Rhodnius prolixus]
MKVLVTYTTFLVLFLNVQARSYFQRDDYTSTYEDDEQQNSLSPVGSGGTGVRKNSNELMKDFVKITSSTEGVIKVKQGDTIELECTAVGSFTPSVDWYKGDIPVTYGEDNNYITKFGVTRMVVRYIEDCAQLKHEGTYTCQAESGSASMTSPSVTVFVSEKMSPRMLKNGGSCKQDQKLARITRYSPVVMHTMGTDAKLLCRARGFPRPYVYWTDKSGNILDTSAGSRYKILDSGDLIIRNLRWPDMGVYMCVAENSVGKDIISTFLYPMLDD